MTNIYHIWYNRKNVLEGIMAEEKVNNEELEKILDKLNKDINQNSTDNEVADNPQPENTDIESDELKNKHSRVGVSLQEKNITLPNGEVVETISQNVEIENKQTEEKFEDQNVSVFENPKGDSTLLLISQENKTLATVEENKENKICLKLSVEYIENILNSGNYTDAQKEQIKNIFGNKIENGFYQLSPAEGSNGKVSLSKDLNLDTIEFQATDGKTYGVKFTALGMQLKYADGSDSIVLTNPLKLREKGKTEGERPYDISISSAYFEKADNSKIIVSNELKGEVLDNILVCALRSRTRARKVQEMKINDRIKLVSVPVGDKNSVISHLDLKIEDGKPSIYVQIKKTDSRSSNKPRFYEINSAAIVQNESGEQYLSLNLENGAYDPNVHIPIKSLTARKNVEALMNGILANEFKKGVHHAEEVNKSTPIKIKNKSKRETVLTFGNNENSVPVYHVSTNQLHEISGEDVASLIRSIDQTNLDDTDGDGDGQSPFVSPILQPETPSESEEEPKQVPEEGENEEDENKEGENKEKQKDEPAAEKKPEENKKPDAPAKNKKKGSVSKFFGSNYTLGLAIILVMVSTLVPFVAPIAAILLGGFCFQQADGFKMLGDISSAIKIFNFGLSKEEKLEKSRNKQLDKEQKASIKKNLKKSKKDEKKYESLSKKISKEKNKKKKEKYQKQLNTLIEHSNFLKSRQYAEEKKKETEEKKSANDKEEKKENNNLSNRKDKKKKEKQKKDKDKKSEKGLESYSLTEDPASKETPSPSQTDKNSSSVEHTAGDGGKDL